MLLVGLVRWGACSDADVVDAAAAAAAASSRLFSLSDVDVDEAILTMRITNKAAAEGPRGWVVFVFAVCG